MSAASDRQGALRLLAFDTSTERMSIAVHDGARAHVVDAEGGAAASATLLPLLKQQLARAGLELADVDAIAFGRGPGAFTGLRTACAVAQGLAFGLGVPVLPIDSLLIVAEDARQQAWDASVACRAGEGSSVNVSQATFDVAVAMDARMNEIYAGRYRYGPRDDTPHSAPRHPPSGAHGRADGCKALGDADPDPDPELGWQVVQAPALVPVADLPSFWEAPVAALAGSALTAFGAAALLPAGSSLSPTWPRPLQTFAQQRDRPGALLRLALAGAQDGAGTVDAADGLPLYLRDKVAQTTAERDAVKAAAGCATMTATATASPQRALRAPSRPAARDASGEHRE